MKAYALFTPLLSTIRLKRDRYTGYCNPSSICGTLEPRLSHIRIRAATSLAHHELDMADPVAIDPTSIIALLIFSIMIGVTAQTFITSMIQGDQGLGAYLSDGDGFSNSRFKPIKKKMAKVDPLPWLKLPKLDFVEVAGQDEVMDPKPIDRLERVRTLIKRMDTEIEQGELQRATETKMYIDSLLNDSQTD